MYIVYDKIEDKYIKKTSPRREYTTDINKAKIYRNIAAIKNSIGKFYLIKTNKKINTWHFINPKWTGNHCKYYKYAIKFKENQCGIRSSIDLPKRVWRYNDDMSKDNLHPFWPEGFPHKENIVNGDKVKVKKFIGKNYKVYKCELGKLIEVKDVY